jgi:CRISPR-associated endonuclease Csn1
MKSEIEFQSALLKDQLTKEKLFEELSYKDKLSKTDALKILFGKNAKGYDLNYKDLEGNRTLFELFKAYFNIIELSGRDCESLLKLSSKEMVSAVRDVFKVLGIDTDILVFNSDDNPTKQPIYNLWHLLYSFEADNSNTGDEKLIE